MDATDNLQRRWRQSGPVVDPVDGGAFRTWLATELRARRMSGRQLADRSGVAASTVSRILRGDRRPRLQTALRLGEAMSIKVASGAPTNVFREAGEVDPVTHVERALRSDAALEDQDVRDAMRVYLGLRSRRARATRRAPETPKG